MKISGLVAGELELQVKATGGTVVINWLGRSVSRTPAAELKPYSAQLREALAGRNLVLDFRELKYMNSSTIRPIIEMIQTASQTATAVEVRYQSSVTWQRLSFKLIEALAKEWPNVTISG